ncbi:MAG: glycosyltransferase family 39 protein [Caldilineaceae bacterium]|nr:glycosyltransferase family 39 protein [Caldilineaceae bacterium]
MLSLRRYEVICLALDLAAHLIMFGAIGPALVQAAALLYAVFVAPGLLLIGLLPDDRLTAVERLLLGPAIGVALLPLVLLLLSYLPGPLTLAPILLAFDGIALAAALLVRRNGLDRSGEAHLSLWTRRALLALLSVLALTAYFRLTNLHYAELQGDEAKVVLYAVSVIQGNEEALFLHRRGPADVLTSALMAVLNAPRTEVVFRLPFALISILVVGLLFLLAREIRNLSTAWLAGLLLAGEGLFIAFSRIVQYQAFIHLSAVGALYALWRLSQKVRTRRGAVSDGLLSGYLWPAALFFVAGLLAHYEAIIILPAAAYLLWRMTRDGLPPARLLRAMAGPAVFTVMAFIAFYAPFLLNPRFQSTAARYGKKVMGDFRTLFDHLPLFIERSGFYNFRPSVWAILIVLALYPLLVYPQQGRMRAVSLVGSGAFLAALAGAALSLTLFPPFRGPATALFLLTATFAPAIPVGERMLWLWFGSGFFLSVFLIRDPNLHFYIFLAPMLLLTAITLDRAWTRFIRLSGNRIQALSMGAAAVLLALFLPRFVYAQFLFVDHVPEIQRTWSAQQALPRWLRGSNPAGHPIFGFPHQSGWKTVGVLYDTGILQGSYRTNVRDWVSAWYTRSAEYCEEASDWVILESVERPQERAELLADIGDHYVKRGEIYVGDRLGIELYGRNHGDPGPPVRYQAEAFSADFDARLANSDLHPAVEELSPPLEALAYRFGDKLELTGYDLYQTEVRPGQALSLLLRWEALASSSQDIALFAQVIGPEDRKLGQRDRDPACSHGPVREWAPGDVTVGHLRIPLDPAAPPGAYPLIIGLYDRQSGARLPIYAADGAYVGDALTLTEIRVVAP